MLGIGASDKSSMIHVLLVYYRAQRSERANTKKALSDDVTRTLVRPKSGEGRRASPSSLKDGELTIRG